MAAALAPYPRLQFFDGNGETYPAAKLYTYIAGTVTPKSTFSDADLTTANANPVVADADGRFGAVYLSAASYKFVLKTTADVTVWTQDNILEPGDYFASNFGVAMSVGSKNVTTGYVLLLTDRLVTVASSGATTFNLASAATFTMDITIKNMLTGTVVIKANGAELIDGIAGSPSQFTLEAAATPLFPAVTLRPITGGWLIVSSHRAQ